MRSRTLAVDEAFCTAVCTTPFGIEVSSLIMSTYLPVVARGSQTAMQIGFEYYSKKTGRLDFL
jgi:hypothetical protein